MEFDEAMTYYDGLLHDFLSSDVATFEQAVTRFVAPICAAYVDGSASSGDVAGMLWAAWGAVIRVATDRPDTQDHLVRLATGISAQGPLVRDADGRVCQVLGNLTVFTDLPCMGAQMREHLDIVAHRHANGGDHVPRENFMAFAARLTAAGIDFSRFAVWTFRECVETEPVDLTLFRIWHRFGGSGLVRGLIEHAAQAPLLLPASATPEAGDARGALRLIEELDRERRDG